MKRRFLQRKNFLFHKNIFQKKQKTKRDKSRYKNGFLKRLKKEVKKMRTRKKRKIGRNLEKQDLQKVQKER